MKTQRGWMKASVVPLFAAVMLVTACSTTQQEEAEVQTNDGQVLNTTETAPADLQLTCSSAAANQFGLAPDKILPVSSSKLPDATYQVELSANGQTYLCTIDDNARVISVIPA